MQNNIPVSNRGSITKNKKSITREELAMSNRDEIFNTVRDCLIEALSVSPDAIAPDVSLIGDLEAESIDFLDIVFRLENAFHIEIQRGELFPQEILRDPANVNQGKITEAGVTKLREKFYFTDLAG